MGNRVWNCRRPIIADLAAMLGLADQVVGWLVPAAMPFRRFAKQRSRFATSSFCAHAL
jgi:hypothetical protein